MRYFLHNSPEPGARPKSAVILTDKEWLGITNKLEVSHLEELKTSAEQQRQMDKKIKSLEMTHNWNNTVASAHKKRQENYGAAAKKAEDERKAKYEEILKKKERERQEVLEKAKKIVYETKESSQRLCSGLILSAVLKEREKQVQLKNHQKLEAVANAADEAAKIRKDAEEYENYVLWSKHQDVQNRRMVREMLDEQMEEVSEIRNKCIELKEEEKKELVHLQKELEAEIESERKEALKKKMDLWQQQEKMKEISEQYKKQKEQEDKEEDEMNSIFRDVRAQLEKQQREKEIEIRREIIVRRQKVPENMLPKLPDYTDEEESLKKALAENERKYQNEQVEKTVRKAKLCEEVREFEKQYEKSFEEEGLRQLQIKRLEVAQRLAKYEADKQWYQEQRERKWKDQLSLRKTLIDQWNERDEKDKMEKIDDITHFLREVEYDNEALKKYCDEIEDYTKEKKKPLYPVLDAIKKVKKSAGLSYKRRVAPFLISRVPIESVSVYAEMEKAKK